MKNTKASRGQIKSNAQDRMIKLYLLDCICADGYAEPHQQPETMAEKIDFLKQTFESEYGWSIKRYGRQKALAEWIAGLPSSYNVDFQNYKILELGLKWGLLSTDDYENDDKCCAFLERWFSMMAGKTCQLFDGYHLPK